MDNDGKEEVELELDDEVYDALVIMAATRNETLDETMEHILQQMMEQDTKND
jgi:hypothetical protein